MPSRRQFSGNASAQTLTADLTSVAATATISSATGWPNGAVGPFAVVIDRGTNVEEKCLCSGLSGNTLTFQTRGYDGTGGAAHSNGATVELCLTAIDLDEANAHTSAVAGVHGVSGNVVGTTDTQTIANKTFIQPTITDHTNANHDHTTNGQGGVIPYIASPLQTLSAHFGTVSLTPGSSTVVFPHGAPFTPLTGFISGSANVPFTSIIITAYGLTNLTVVFYDAASNTPLAVGTCNLSFVLFG